MKKIIVLFVLLVLSGLGALAQDTRSPDKHTSVTFAQLSAMTRTNGWEYYVSDGSPTSPCTGGGTGALAVRVNGAWNCSTGGSGAPGGSNGQIQYNNSGAFGGLASTGTGDVARAASPALTGTPTAPTAAADTNTTQLATTAYVIGQGYLKSATASSTYAPIASPTFTTQLTSPKVITSGGGVDVQIGGTSSSFPALKKSGATVNFVLADDSAFTSVGVLNAYVTTQVRTTNAGLFSWTNAAGNPNTGGSVDTSISRNAAGVVQVGSGTTANGNGKLIAASVVLGSTTAKPTCDSSTRGTYYHFFGGAGVKDTVEVCAKDAGDAYAWRVIY